MCDRDAEYLTHFTNIKWDMVCDFQQYGILTSVDSDKPLQPPY